MGEMVKMNINSRPSNARALTSPGIIVISTEDKGSTKNVKLDLTIEMIPMDVTANATAKGPIWDQVRDT